MNVEELLPLLDQGLKDKIHKEVGEIRKFYKIGDEIDFDLIYPDVNPDNFQMGRTIVIKVPVRGEELAIKITLEDNNEEIVRELNNLLKIDEIYRREKISPLDYHTVSLQSDFIDFINKKNGKVDSFYWIPMLYEADSLTLSEFCSLRENFNPLIALKIIDQLAEIIQVIHDNDLVFYDWNPQNILVNRHNFRVKICDFGSARNWKSSDTLIAAHSIPIAPELVRKPTEKIFLLEDENFDPVFFPVGEEADLYSLGVISFFILCEHSEKEIEDIRSEVIQIGNQLITYDWKSLEEKEWWTYNKQLIQQVQDEPIFNSGTFEKLMNEPNPSLKDGKIIAKFMSFYDRPESEQLGWPKITLQTASGLSSNGLKEWYHNLAFLDINGLIDQIQTQGLQFNLRQNVRKFENCLNRIKEKINIELIKIKEIDDSIDDSSLLAISEILGNLFQILPKNRSSLLTLREKVKCAVYSIKIGCKTHSQCEVSFSSNSGIPYDSEHVKLDGNDVFLFDHLISPRPKFDFQIGNQLKVWSPEDFDEKTGPELWDSLRRMHRTGDYQICFEILDQNHFPIRLKLHGLTEYLTHCKFFWSKDPFSIKTIPDSDFQKGSSQLTKINSEDKSGTSYLLDIPLPDKTLVFRTGVSNHQQEEIILEEQLLEVEANDEEILGEILGYCRVIFFLDINLIKELVSQGVDRNGIPLFELSFQLSIVKERSSKRFILITDQKSGSEKRFEKPETPAPWVLNGFDSLEKCIRNCLLAENLDLQKFAFRLEETITSDPQFTNFRNEWGISPQVRLEDLQKKICKLITAKRRKLIEDFKKQINQCYRRDIILQKNIVSSEKQEGSQQELASSQSSDWLKENARAELTSIQENVKHLAPYLKWDFIYLEYLLFWCRYEFYIQVILKSCHSDFKKPEDLFNRINEFFEKIERIMDSGENPISNGLKKYIDSIRQDFLNFRLGISKKREDKDFDLSSIQLNQENHWLLERLWPSSHELNQGEQEDLWDPYKHYKQEKQGLESLSLETRLNMLQMERHHYSDGRIRERILIEESIEKHLKNKTN
jgi:serine/threonine protein kinase